MIKQKKRALRLAWIRSSLILTTLQSFSRPLSILVEAFPLYRGRKFWGAAPLCKREPTYNALFYSQRPVVTNRHAVPAPECCRRLYSTCSDDEGEIFDLLRPTNETVIRHDDDEQYQEVDTDVTEHDPDNSSSLWNEYLQWKESVNECLDALEKKYNSLQAESRKFETINETAARAQLLTRYMYMFQPGIKSAVVSDWEKDGIDVTLTLDPNYDSAQEEAQALFQTVRKLKRGSKQVSLLLQETIQSLETIREIQLDLNGIATLEDAYVDENGLRLIQERLLSSMRSIAFTAPKKTVTTQRQSVLQKQQQHKQKQQQKPKLGELSFMLDGTVVGTST
jgi:hypothetical protein